MIAVDTSALVAILKSEADASIFTDALNDADTLSIGAATRFELLLVMANTQGQEGVDDAKALLDAYCFKCIDFTEAMSDAAAQAFLTFGKSRHPAKLNFGDCMTYALAASLDAPLLFKGDDFAQTDIRSAL